jgi:hypothetical protein
MYGRQADYLEVDAAAETWAVVEEVAQGSAEAAPDAESVGAPMSGAREGQGGNRGGEGGDGGGAPDRRHPRHRRRG